jgi:hypothetical protein
MEQKRESDPLGIRKVQIQVVSSTDANKIFNTPLKDYSNAAYLVFLSHQRTYVFNLISPRPSRRNTLTGLSFFGKTM